jgi:hypothetical protein
MGLDFNQTKQLKDFVLSPSNPAWEDISDFMKDKLVCEGDCSAQYAAAFVEFPKVLDGLDGKKISKIFSFIAKRKIKDSPALRQKLTPDQVEALGFLEKYPTVAAVLW